MHLLPTRERQSTTCGAPLQDWEIEATPEINNVTCEACMAIHDNVQYLESFLEAKRQSRPDDVT